MKILTTLTLLLLITAQVSAGTVQRTEDVEKIKEYDIEIIIFEDAHARYLNSEMWPHDSTDEPATLSGPDTHTITVTPLADSLQQAESDNAEKRIFKNIKPGILDKEYSRLNRSSEFNVLFYGAWRQQGLEKSRAFEIDINELVNRHQGNTVNSVDGHFKVVLARYLHLYSELEYLRQSASEEAAEFTQQYETQMNNNSATYVNKVDATASRNSIFQVNNHRRMRSKELHYIDHPLVGMLVQINTVETSEKSN